MYLVVNYSDASRGAMSLIPLGFALFIIFCTLAFILKIVGIPFYYGYGGALWATLYCVVIFIISKALMKSYKDSQLLKSVGRLSIIGLICSFIIVFYNAFIIVPQFEKNLNLHKNTRFSGYDSKNHDATIKSLYAIMPANVTYNSDNVFDSNNFELSLKTLSEGFRQNLRTQYGPKMTEIDKSMFLYALSCSIDGYAIKKSFFCNNVEGIKISHGFDFVKITNTRNKDLSKFIEKLDMNILHAGYDTKKVFDNINPVSCAFNNICQVLGLNGISPFSNFVSPNNEEKKLIEMMAFDGKNKISNNHSNYNFHENHWRAPIIESVYVKIRRSMNPDF